MTHPPVKRKLVATSCTPLATLRSGATLYEVFAVDEEGEPVQEELRSFQELDLGELVEYEVTRYDDPERGTSFTLKRQPKNTARRVDELEKRVDELEKRLAALEEA